MGGARTGKPGWRFQGKQRNDLEDVILDNITQSAGRFLDSAATADAELLGYGYPHASHAD
jgi:hypothetical protein